MYGACMFGALYEGVPMVPVLISNMKNKEDGARPLGLATFLMYLIIQTFAPLSIIVFGKSLEETVLVNLGSGHLELFLLFL